VFDDLNKFFVWLNVKVTVRTQEIKAVTVEIALFSKRRIATSDGLNHPIFFIVSKKTYETAFFFLFFISLLLLLVCVKKFREEKKEKRREEKRRDLSFLLFFGFVYAQQRV